MSTCATCAAQLARIARPPGTVSTNAPACRLNQDASVRFAFAIALLAACHPPGYGKGDDTPTVDAAPKHPDAAIDAPAATTCAKEFRLDNSGAATVWLTGEFVNWGGNPGAGAVELAKGGDGIWSVMRTMDAGAHQYKFIVDGNNWIMDPANPNTIDDGFGGKNSLYTCTP